MSVESLTKKVPKGWDKQGNVGLPPVNWAESTEELTPEAKVVKEMENFKGELSIDTLSNWIEVVISKDPKTLDIECLNLNDKKRWIATQLANNFEEIVKLSYTAIRQRLVFHNSGIMSDSNGLRPLAGGTYLKRQIKAIFSLIEPQPIQLDIKEFLSYFIEDQGVEPSVADTYDQVISNLPWDPAVEEQKVENKFNQKYGEMKSEFDSAKKELHDSLRDVLYPVKDKNGELIDTSEEIKRLERETEDLRTDTNIYRVNLKRNTTARSGETAGSYRNKSMRIYILEKELEELKKTPSLKPESRFMNALTGLFGTNVFVDRNSADYSNFSDICGDTSNERYKQACKVLDNLDRIEYHNRDVKYHGAGSIHNIDLMYMLSLSCEKVDLPTIIPDWMKDAILESIDSYKLSGEKIKELIEDTKLSIKIKFNPLKKEELVRFVTPEEKDKLRFDKTESDSFAIENSKNAISQDYQPSSNSARNEFYEGKEVIMTVSPSI